MRTFKILLSWLLCAVSMVVFWHYGDTYLMKVSDSNGPYELAKLIGSAAGTLLGFLLTAVSLMTAVMDRTLIANMRQSGHYQRLVKQAFLGCMLLLLLFLVCVGLLFTSGLWLKIFVTLMIGLTVAAMLVLVSAGRRFYNIFVVMS